jgi:hypothetical protein
LIDAMLDLLVRSTAFMTHALSLLATLAAVLGGLLAAYASWHLTDLLLARRQHTD